MLAELDALEAAIDDDAREHLAERISTVRRRLEEEAVVLAVLGEYKQGKSTLVNALLRTDICPVDADRGTAVPTVLAFGSPARAQGVPTPAKSAVRADAADASDPDGEADGEPGPAPVAVPLDVHDLAAAVLERPPADTPPLSSVEVFLDRALLRTGLTIIDTPGLGGLESAHGVAALGVLPLAHAALFVTDASQELTRPELDYLRRVVDACPIVICVVTKTDLHADWQRVVELDRKHLADAGLAVPVVGVSSFLRMRGSARRDPRLQEQSGFPVLLDALRFRVLRRADALAVAAVRADLELIRGQVQQQVVAEREVLERPPEEKVEVVRHLEEATARARRLVSRSASWQVVLADEIHVLEDDVAHDLRQRLLSVRHAGEAKLAAADPRAIWTEFEAWVRAEAMAAAVANAHVLVERAEQLATAVGERFALEVESLDVDLPVVAVALSRVTRLRVDFTDPGARRLLGMLTAARISSSGAVVGGAAGSALTAVAGLGAAVGATLAPVGAAVTLVLARRLIREDRNREIELRRQLARQELYRYLDEVGFVLGKESRDAVTRTRIFLRDEFTARANAVRESSAASLATAVRAAGLEPRQAAARSQDLAEQGQRAGVAVPRARERST